MRLDTDAVFRIEKQIVAGMAVTIERRFQLNRVRINAHRSLTACMTMTTGSPMYSGSCDSIFPREGCWRFA